MGKNPKSLLNEVVPKEGNWVEHDENGRRLFGHGYGGGPIMLPSGELYLDELGRAPFVHEVVWEQRNKIDLLTSHVKKLPYRTVIAVAYLDSTLSKVLSPSTPILDVFNEKGEIWNAAHRPGLGPLAEEDMLRCDIAENRCNPWRRLIKYVLQGRCWNSKCYLALESTILTMEVSSQNPWLIFITLSPDRFRWRSRGYYRSAQTAFHLVGATGDILR